MFSTIISDGAENDLNNSCAWYEMQVPGLSKRFLKQFFNTLNIIQANPNMYQVKHREKYRFAKIKGFPYVIAFKTDKQNIFINAVFHTSRDPKDF